MQAYFLKLHLLKCAPWAFFISQFLSPGSHYTSALKCLYGQKFCPHVNVVKHSCYTECWNSGTFKAIIFLLIRAYLCLLLSLPKVPLWPSTCLTLDQNFKESSGFPQKECKKINDVSLGKKSGFLLHTVEVCWIMLYH